VCPLCSSVIFPPLLPAFPEEVAGLVRFQLTFTIGSVMRALSSRPRWDLREERIIHTFCLMLRHVTLHSPRAAEATNLSNQVNSFWNSSGRMPSRSDSVNNSPSVVRDWKFNDSIDDKPRIRIPERGSPRAASCPTDGTTGACRLRSNYDSVYGPLKFKTRQARPSYIRPRFSRAWRGRV